MAITGLQFNFVGFRDCDKVTEGGGRFTGVDEGGVIGRGGDVLGIAESASAKDKV